VERFAQTRHVDDQQKGIFSCPRNNLFHEPRYVAWVFGLQAMRKLLGSPRRHIPFPHEVGSPSLRPQLCRKGICARRVIEVQDKITTQQREQRATGVPRRRESVGPREDALRIQADVAGDVIGRKSIPSQPSDMHNHNIGGKRHARAVLTSHLSAKEEETDEE
jgi:hypothetical protein